MFGLSDNANKSNVEQPQATTDNSIPSLSTASAAPADNPAPVIPVDASVAPEPAVVAPNMPAAPTMSPPAVMPPPSIPEPTSPAPTSGGINDVSLENAYIAT